MAATIINNIFSHPVFYPTGNWTTTGYNLFKSGANSDGSPNYFGPWVAVPGYSAYTQNTDIVDVNGTYYDLYRVQPIVYISTPSGYQTLSLAMSRPIFAWQTVYDIQISSLLDHFRKNYIKDDPIPRTDSTLPQESSGAAILPFITDALTTRYFLSFLPTDDPIKVIAETVQVFQGGSKAAATQMAPYSDFFPSEDGGYIDFAVAPAANNYLQVQYKAVRYSNDEVRSAVLNAISALSLYGINGYQIMSSNNLQYLVVPLPTNDLAEIVCQIAYKNLVAADINRNLQEAEEWDDGKFKYTADPSRSIQAATMHVSNYEENIHRAAQSYILNTRNYNYRGEFESYFDMTGILPIYALIVAGTNLAGAMGYWM